MHQVVLQRKFSVPTDGELFHRPQLIQALNRYSLDPVTVIHAPAGYGKTSLVCDWIQYAQHPVYWLSLDKQDNLPSAFWIYLYSCLQKIDRDLDDQALQMLNNQFVEDYMVICDLLLSSLEKLSRKWNRPSRVVIVLDDFHFINHPQILQPLNRFIDYMPNWLQLVITSRELPKLMLPNRCSKAKAHIIDATELKFKAESIADFLATKLGLKLSQQELEIISEHTEGWAAAIQLTGLALRSGARLEDCTRTRDSLLAEFLFDEIFSQLDNESQKLLNDISIVDYFTLDLCQRLDPERENETILQTLVQQGLFISKVDEQSPTFRLHSLFRQWLQDHVKENAKRLHHNQNTALAWLGDIRDYHQALELSITLKDWKCCSETMKLLYPSLVSIHHFDHVSSVLHRIPEDIIISLPHFCLIKGLLNFSLFNYDQVEKYTGHIETYFENPLDNNSISVHEKTSLLMGSRILRAQMARFSGNAERANRLQADIESAFEDIEHELQCWLIFGKAVDLFLADKINRALPYFQSALALAQNSKDGLCVISTLGWLLHAFYHNGQIRQGIKLAEINIQWIHKHGLQRLPNVSSIYAALVTLYLEDNQLQKAWDNYSLILDNINDYTEPREVIYNKFYTHFHLLISTGRYKEAHSCLRQLESFENQFGRNINSHFSVVLETHILDALLELRQGNSFQLLQLSLDDCNPPLSKGDHCQFRRLYESMIMATRSLIMTSEASEEFSQLALISIESGNISRAITCHLIPAKILKKQGYPDQALEHFKQALSINAKHEFINLFIDDETNTSPLIQLALAQDIETEFCQGLITAIQSREQQTIQNHIERKGMDKKEDKAGLNQEKHSSTSSASFDQYNQGMIEGLSPRELEVLSFINQGLRNKQIADQLAISLSTVKRHLQNIYQKLQVSSRTEAIAILNRNHSP